MAFTITSRQVKNHYYDESIAEGIFPLRMMRVPAGNFMMGSPETELERKAWEGPQHEVAVSQFFMAKYPVTQAQWQAVTEMPQVNRALKSAPSHFASDFRPVESVSWHDAVEFCDRLTIATNRQYRLPTEAEWEYACRSRTNTPFHCGVTLSIDFANYHNVRGENSIYSLGDSRNGHDATTNVGHFECANVYGLCDMHGNVWEWCQDYWHDGYQNAPTDGSAWLTIHEDSGISRVLRGGSWSSQSKFCRSAYRRNDSPTFWSKEIGFRVVCDGAFINARFLKKLRRLQKIDGSQQELASINRDLLSCQQASAWLKHNIDNLSHFAPEVIISEQTIFSELRNSRKSLSEEDLKTRFASDIAAYLEWILKYLRDGRSPEKMDKTSLYYDFKKRTYDRAFSKITKGPIDPITSQLSIGAAEMLTSYINLFIIDEKT